MSKTDIGNTLRDIAEESSLSLAEKTSLKRIAKEYDKLHKENEYLRKQLKSRVSDLVWRNMEQLLK